MKRLLAVMLACTLSANAFAGGTCSGVKGGCGRSHSSGVGRSSSPGGTVHVSGYMRKDGTYVRPHTRRAPGTASVHSSVADEPLADDPPAVRIPKVRTTARTTARTHAWNGNATDQDEREPAAVPTQPAVVTKSEYRLWTDRTGNFKVEAKFGGMTAQTVTLEKMDGVQLKVPFDNLSPQDQAWINRRKK